MAKHIFKLIALLPILAACGTKEARRPNIILIVADDLGYGDLSLHGCERVSTPNIDRLARGGVRFTNGYANSSICAPTRAALMTGRYQQRSGYVGFTGPMELQVGRDRGLDVEQVLLSETLQRAGYVTGAIGKWHLGINEQYRPNQRGFDEFFGFLHGAHDYIKWNSERFGPIYRNGEIVDGQGYLTHAFSDEAVAFIERHQQQPFFLYLAYNAVHSPHQVRERYKQQVGDPALDAEGNFANAGTRTTCLAMGIAMDEGIGRILDTLDELKLSHDTMVVFVNDNGGVESVSDNRPFRGGKVSMYEGGIRVPFFVRYPAALEAGSRFAPVTSTMDLYPTFVALAGAELPLGIAFDGVDLMPHLLGTQTEDPHPVHFWSLGHNSAVRQQDLKLLVIKNAEPALYDLASDPSESVDLAKQHPEKVQSMMALLHAWKKEMPPPAWTLAEDKAWLAQQTERAE